MDENMTTATTAGKPADSTVPEGQHAAAPAETEPKVADGAAVSEEKAPAEKSPGEDTIRQLTARFEKEKAAAVAAAASEAAKKAAMQPEEAAEYEKQQREAALVQKEKELQIREMRNDTKDILLQKDIPAGFADFLLGEDMEQTQANISSFKKEFDTAVQAQVEQRMKGTTPRVSSGITGTGTNTLANEIDRYL